MYSSPESRDPDSGGVCSACVRIFQKRDGETRAPRKIWEKAWICGRGAHGRAKSARTAGRANSRKSFRRASYHQGIAGLYLKLILLALGDS